MNKIGINELFAICFSLCVALFPCFGTAIILVTARNASIVTTFVGAIIGFIFLFMILYILNWNKNNNIFKNNYDNFKLFGSLFNIIYVIGFIYIEIIITWGLINFITSHLLIRNNPYVITLVLFFIIYLAIIKGKEVFSRCCLGLFYILLIVLFFTFTFLTPHVEISNLFPIIDTSFKNIGYSIYMISSFAVIPFISILSYKKNDISNEKKVNRTIYFAYISGIICLMIFLFLIISIYGINIASIFSYPEYYMFKKINSFNFIQRIENILSLNIFIAFFGCLCNSIYFIKTFINQTFNVKSINTKKYIVLFITIIIPLLSIYLFRNFKISFLFRYYPIFSIVLLITLFINFIFVFIKKRIS